MKTVAAIFAHPDDEVLGCGATISRLAREGSKVYILILATGLSSRGKVRPEDFERLRSQAVLCSEKLSASSIEFSSFPDNSMDSIPLLEIVKSVESFIQKVEPDIIFTHHNSDINVDHDITQRAVLTATRPLPGVKQREILACEVLSSTEFGNYGARFRPNCYYGVSEEDVTSAIAGLECYEGEVREAPHPRSADVMINQFRLRGSECGCMAAEAFEVLRSIRF